MSLVSSGTSTYFGPISALTIGQYIMKVRKFLGDLDDIDQLAASVSDVDTSIQVKHPKWHSESDPLSIGEEMMRVAEVVLDAGGNPTGVLNVDRGIWLTTPASYVINDAVYHTIWDNEQIADAVNESFGIIYPSLYIRSQVTLAGDLASTEYALPVDVVEGRQVESVEIAYATIAPIKEMPYGVRVYGNPPILTIPFDLTGWTIYVTYVKPFPPLLDSSQQCQLPFAARNLPTLYACARLMEQREAIRSHNPGYTPPSAEFGIREGQQQQTGSYYQKLFDRLVGELRMQPPGGLSLYY